MKLKTVYICSECGARSPKWMGKCTACGAWNSFVEDVVDETPTPAASARHTLTARTGEHRAVPYREMEMPDYIRTVTGLFGTGPGIGRRTGAGFGGFAGR